MTRFTKKYMVEDYERLHAHADILELYLSDTQAGRKPDAVETYKDANCDVRVQLWRATGAHGGYVVIKETMANVWLLEDVIRMYAGNFSEHTLGIRICLERLRVIRNRMCQPPATSHHAFTTTAGIKSHCATCGEIDTHANHA